MPFSARPLLQRQWKFFAMLLCLSFCPITCCGERKVPIILYSGKPPENMRNVDGFINKDESVPRFLSLVGDFVKRYWE
jgi:hypothetical protein